MQEISCSKPVRAPSRGKLYWEKIITEWKQSGEPQKVFCERLGIKPNTFHHWRVIFLPKEKPPKNKFVKVKIKPSLSSSLRPPLIIESPHGYKITVPFVVEEIK